MPREFVFSNTNAAIAALVRQCAQIIADEVAASGSVVFAVGGGRSPRQVLPHLAKLDCGWEHVTVTLTDDRCVAVDDPASNEGMVRSCLLRDHAAAATFRGLLADSTEAPPPQPDIVYLGFGEDGHVASLFPGGRELDAGHAGIVSAHAPVAPHRRVSLTLNALYAAKHIVMLVSGEAKHQIYRAARDQAHTATLPLARILHQDKAPVCVYMDGA